MTSSVHVGLLNTEFCDKFETLFNDIYINENKLNLINEKIKFHRQSDGTFINGGICDMTFYYLLQSEKYLDVQNLGEPIEIDGKKHVFMNILMNGEGQQNMKQYRLKNGLMEVRPSENGKDNTIFDQINNEEHILWNIHFQGSAKRFLNDNITKQINVE